MGSGASVESASKLPDEELIKIVSEFYKASPEKCDYVVSQAKKVASKEESKTSGDAKLPLTDDFEKEIIDALNMVRTKPKDFAFLIESKHLSTFEDDMIFQYTAPNGEKQRIQTSEGVAGVKEAIEFLQQFPHELPPLQWSPLLTKAAFDHANDIGKSGSTSHVGSDGSTLTDRVKKYAFSTTLGENLDFGNSDPLRIVWGLIIDDGVKSRGHRKNIMNPEFKTCGASLTSHSLYNLCCVIDLAGDVKNLSDIVTKDCEVSTKGYLSDEFKKVLFSIPSNDNCASIVSELEPHLKNAAEVKLTYRPSEHFATFEILLGNSISTLKISWKEG